MTLDETKKVDIASVSTGSIGLDEALGIGGYPRGRIVEIVDQSHLVKPHSPSCYRRSPKRRRYLY